MLCHNITFLETSCYTLNQTLLYLLFYFKTRLVLCFYLYWYHLYIPHTKFMVINIRFLDIIMMGLFRVLILIIQNKYKCCMFKLDKTIVKYIYIYDLVIWDISYI